MTKKELIKKIEEFIEEEEDGIEAYDELIEDFYSIPILFSVKEASDIILKIRNDELGHVQDLERVLKLIEKGD